MGTHDSSTCPFQAVRLAISLSDKTESLHGDKTTIVLARSHYSTVLPAEHACMYLLTNFWCTCMHIRRHLHTLLQNANFQLASYNINLQKITVKT